MKRLCAIIWLLAAGVVLGAEVGNRTVPTQVPAQTLRTFRFNVEDKIVRDDSIETTAYDVNMVLGYRTTRFGRRQYLLFQENGELAGSDGFPELAARIYKFEKKYRLVHKSSIAGRHRGMLSHFFWRREIGFVHGTPVVHSAELLGVYEILQGEPQGDPPRRTLSYEPYGYSYSAVPSRWWRSCQWLLREIFKEVDPDDDYNNRFPGVGLF